MEAVRQAAQVSQLWWILPSINDPGNNRKENPILGRGRAPVAWFRGLPFLEAMHPILKCTFAMFLHSAAPFSLVMFLLPPVVLRAHEWPKGRWR